MKRQPLLKLRRHVIMVEVESAQLTKEELECIDYGALIGRVTGKRVRMSDKRAKVNAVRPKLVCR